MNGSCRATVAGSPHPDHPVSDSWVFPRGLGPRTVDEFANERSVRSAGSLRTPCRSAAAGARSHVQSAAHTCTARWSIRSPYRSVHAGHFRTPGLRKATAPVVLLPRPRTRSRSSPTRRAGMTPGLRQLLSATSAADPVSRTHSHRCASRRRALETAAASTPDSRAVTVSAEKQKVSGHVRRSDNKTHRLHCGNLTRLWIAADSRLGYGWRPHRYPLFHSPARPQLHSG